MDKKRLVGATANCTWITKGGYRRILPISDNLLQKEKAGKVIITDRQSPFNNGQTQARLETASTRSTELKVPGAPGTCSTLVTRYQLPGNQKVALLFF